MRRRRWPFIALALAAACSNGVERPAQSQSKQLARMGPGSCHEAAFEPILGSQVVPVTATSGTPALLGFRMLDEVDPAKSFDYVRIDVLPIGVHADDADGKRSLLVGDETHVRRFEASASQLRTRSVSFEFDGRDESGGTMKAGSYEIGFVVRTRSAAPDCGDAPATKWGELTTVIWQPAA